MGRFADVELDELELTGPRLLLRRWRPGDADRVLAIMADPSMYTYLDLPEPYTADAAEQFVTTLGHEGRADGTGVGCAVVERATGRLVGSAALRLTDRDDPDIGYWIAPDARGHGYAAESTRLLADAAFALGVPRVRVDCDVTNLASARVALAAGLRFEGIARDAVCSARSVPSRTGRSDIARFARLPEDPDGPVTPAFPPLPPGGLSDGVVRLRPLAPGDAAEFAEFDDDLARATGFGEPDRTARQYERTTARAGLDWLVGTQARCAVVDIATGALAGSVTLRLAGPPSVGAVGYIVHPLFRGRRYASRALGLLAPWALDSGFVRLELGAKVTNTASQRTAEAAGFDAEAVRARRLREPDGTFADEAHFARWASPTLARDGSGRASGGTGTAYSPRRIRP